jgi:hypothetical protein
MRQAVTILFVTLLAGLGGCAKVSVCFDFPEECPLDVSLKRGELYHHVDGDLYLYIHGRSNRAALTAVLTQAQVSSSILPVVSTPESDTYQISIAAKELDAFSPDRVTLTVFEGQRRGDISVEISVELRPNLSFGPSISGSTSPLIERLGFSGGRLLSLRAYKEGPLNKKRFMQYATPPLKIAEVSSSDYLFSKELGGTRSTADFSKGRVVWLEEISSMGLTLVNCPYNAAGFGSCSNPDSMGYPNNLLPLDIKGFAISPQAEIGVIAEADGTVKYASLPIMTTMPPPLVWTQPAGASAVRRNGRVLLALGDLSGDTIPDLFVLHSDASGRDVTIYKGTSGGGSLALSFDEGLSSAWGEALPKVDTIDAIAVGDLNSDGRAEVAVGSGDIVWVWFNPATGAPVLASTGSVPLGRIRALSIGQADGIKANDLVVASSTTTDPFTANQYLFVYPSQ